MKNIIFIAPPAAGKGTQCDLLVKEYGCVHISTGDLLREEVASKSELGKEIDNLISKGLFVSDEIVTELLKNRLEKDDIKSGFILDGYPRNVNQAGTLKELLKSLGLEISRVFYLEMDEKTSMQRALGRLTCPQCGRGYNKYASAMKPKQDNICDDCNIELTSRSDDTEETFKTRYQVYIENTEPLLNYYKEEGILYMIDNSGTPDETFEQIKRVM